MTADEKNQTPPIAHPIAPTTDASKASVSGPLPHQRESTQRSLLVTSESPSGTERANNKRGSIGVGRLRELANERDLEVLKTVAAHRLISTRQLCNLHFWNHASGASGIRACNRVLTRLMELRLLRRLERPVGGDGGGSGSYVWALDVAGDRLLRATDPNARRRRPFSPSPTFLNHTLAIAERRVEIELAARRGDFELLEVATEPANWRAFRGMHGQTMWLKPDLEVTTAIGDYEYTWFLEQDLGTESGTALLRKCRLYLAYYETGREQRDMGAFPRVIWLMPDERRVALLERLLRAEKAAHDLFWITTTDRLIALMSGPSTFQLSMDLAPSSQGPARGTGT